MLRRILRIKLLFVLIVCFVLVIAQLFSAYIVGDTVEQQMHLQFKHFTNSAFIKVKYYKYQRGFFSSNVTAEIVVNNKTIKNLVHTIPSSFESSDSTYASPVADSSSYTITYTTHIEHGLFAGVLNGCFMPTLAYARTSIIFPDSVKTILNKFFNNSTPLVIDNVVYLNKSGRIKVYSPKFDYVEAVSGIHVIWHGMNLVIDYDKQLSHFVTNASIPLLSVNVPTMGSILLRNINYYEKYSDSVNHITTGTTMLALESADVHWKGESSNFGFRLGDTMHLLTGVNFTNFLNNFDAIDAVNFDLFGLSYRTDSSDNDGFFNAQGIVKFSGLDTNNLHYGPMDLNIAVNHVDSKAFSKFLVVLQEYFANNDESNDSDKLVAVLKQYFAPILVQSPTLKLNTFRLLTPSGLIDISGTIASHNFVLSDMNDESAFMRKFAVDFNFSIPKQTASYLLMLQMEYLLGSNNAHMDATSKNALSKVVNILLENRIAAWAKKKYLNLNGNIISTRLQYESGIYFLNGVQVESVAQTKDKNMHKHSKSI